MQAKFTWLPRFDRTGAAARIVAATDFSPGADRAVERAALLAAARAAELTLVHAVPAGARTSPGDDIAGAAALERLRRTADSIGARHGVACEARVVAGRPATAIAAAAHDADLVVVGSHGDNAGRWSTLGSTVRTLLGSAPCAVLIVRRVPAGAYRRVLAPVDFSTSARTALHAVARTLDDAAIHVVHAFEHPFEGLMRYAAVDDGLIRRHAHSHRGTLARDLPAWAAADAALARPFVFHLLHGHPHNVIDRLLRRLEPELVAIAGHGKSRLAAAVLGTVSLHVARTARCDVLLFGGDRFRRAVEGAERRARAQAGAAERRVPVAATG